MAVADEFDEELPPLWPASKFAKPKFGKPKYTEWSAIEVTEELSEDEERLALRRALEELLEQVEEEEDGCEKQERFYEMYPMLRPGAVVEEAAEVGRLSERDASEQSIPRDEKWVRQMMSEDDPHFVVKVTDMPPSELVCRCGVTTTGPGAMDEMIRHVEEGNRE